MTQGGFKLKQIFDIFIDCLLGAATTCRSP